MTPRRVLVTGGAGFIGSFVVDRMIADGHAITVLDSLEPQVHPAGVPAYLNPAAKLVQGDVRDPAAVAAALDGADTVVHAAATVGVAQSVYEVKRYVDANVGGIATLLQALIDRRQPLRRLVVLASMTGYGEGAYRVRPDAPLVRVDIRSEADIQQHGWEPVHPESGEPLTPAPTPESADRMAANVYALTKRYQEELALSVGGTFGIPVVVLRLFNVYGPRQSLSNPYTGVLSIFLSRLQANQPPVVYEDGRQTRDFVSVHDVTSAVVRALHADEAAGRVFNIGSGIPRRIGETAELLARLVGRPDVAPTITRQFRKGDVRHCTADLTLARRLLGFQPSVSWETGLREVIDWARSAPTADRFGRAHEELVHHGLLSGPMPARSG
jgi:dTDP-L-rhamnose 4-epimerase